MKRFLLFSGDAYYPKGGFWDCNLSFDTVQEAVSFATTKNNDYFDQDWYHVVDTKTMKVVANGGESCYGEGIPQGPQ